LQSSSTNKIYRRLDDLEEDFSWLAENVFHKNRNQYPETITLKDGKTIDCFNVQGFKWALANTLSRTVFVDGSLRLIPLLDFFNHHGEQGKEVELGYMGTFNTMKGAGAVTPVACRAGEQVFCSYGPKSAAEYLLEHGFCPEEALKTAVAEVTFELDQDDRFYDDKLDILEFETYDQAPMDPIQKFDIVSARGRDGDPDPALIQFVRLCKLGGTDAFLLESIFRKEVWEFMALPVSEANELQVINAVTGVCQAALDEFDKCPEGGPAICTTIRQLERKALSSTIEYLLREKEALDLKEYYQQRRLKDLGLDSPWSQEDDSEIGFGQTRTPGSADYDW
jgi:[ribulose-bisphosphate carboxylase]-lysine N-methyltransferase